MQLTYKTVPVLRKKATKKETENFTEVDNFFRTLEPLALADEYFNLRHLFDIRHHSDG
jgi:hypothetical protein